MKVSRFQSVDGAGDTPALWAVPSRRGYKGNIVSMAAAAAVCVIMLTCVIQGRTFLQRCWRVTVQVLSSFRNNISVDSEYSY